jgi:chaperone modulatory protein CbpM
MDIIAVTALFSDLTTVELVHWVEQGWVVPDSEGADFVFREIDVARVRLIHDLRHDMAIAEDAVPLVLSLLDQVYELRSGMRAILHALSSQPEDVRAAILGALEPGGRVP